jgi:aryl-alcohol dehydrogenase-like predicted oxidoreductase
MDYGLKVPGAYGQPSEADAIRLVHAAIEAGINLIDTARAYGDSEAVLGRALRGRRDQVILATKVQTHQQGGSHFSGDGLKRHMRASLDTSLRLLQTGYVDLWQIHNVDRDLLAQIDVIEEVFAEARQAGKVRSVGGSMYGADLPPAALETGVFDTLQVTYSVLDQRLADRVLPLAAENNIGIIVRSILLQGVLTERGDYLPDRLEALRTRSRQFRQLVSNSGSLLSPAQAALAFGLAHRQIGAVLVGVRTLAELEENIQATKITLPDDLLVQLYELRLDDPDLLNPGTWNLYS